ncbi:MAG: alpha/beta hydrolase, partial [Flavobacteriales bacterium]
MKRLLLASFCLFSALISVAQSQHCLADRYSQDALFDSTDIQITTDVHYATSMRWPGAEMDSLRMDVYQPNPAIDPLEKRPLIVMTHGGSFAAGTRSAMAYYCMEMARRGFVTATITYRLGWNCDVAAADPCIICQGEAWRAKVATYRAVQDNRAAIRHLVHNAEEFEVDTAFIFLHGESAGSITSLNSAFWDQSEADSWCTNCVDNVGELDTAGNNLTDTYSIKGVVNNCGAVTNLDVMDGHQIPVISFHNNPDCLVPYGSGQVMNCLGCAAFYWASGSNSIQARLNTNGVCTQRHARSELLPDHCTYYTQPLL